MNTKLCRQTRKCRECGFVEKRDLPPLEAAFEHGRVWKGPCLKCGLTQLQGGTTEIPPLSAEQLEVWANNEEFEFSSQDEDIVLARPESLALLLQCLDDSRTPASKRATLLAALFVIIYDHLGPGRQDRERVDQVVSALSERAAVIDELGTHHIDEYILKRVRTVLGDLLTY